LWSDYCLVEKILKMEVRFFTYLSERKWAGEKKAKNT
jgi:hypothetical protein